MSDQGPNYGVERLRLEVQVEEHEQTIAKGGARLAEITRQKAINLRKTELTNAELDDEARRIAENEAALKESIANIKSDLAAMTKQGG